MTRWTPRRKAEIVTALLDGHLSLTEAARAYDASLEELTSWGRDMQAWGVAGLRTTRLQAYQPERKAK
jgi:transposase-like protein